MNFRSKNELAETAIRFYIAYHTAEIHTDFLRKVMTEGCVDAMRTTENRIAKIAYKSAVETAMINLALMDSMDLSEKQIQKYRNKAVAILNETHEHLTLGRAKKFKAAEVLHNIIPTYDPEDSEYYTPYGGDYDDEE